MISLLFLLSAYPWPIRPFNTAHGVSATLGDGRGSATAPRFHRGIDIPDSAGTDVFSLTSGIARWTRAGDGIRVGNYWYIHLNNMILDSSRVTGILDTTTTHPTQIGDISGDHLHFQIGPSGGPYSNPLSTDGGPVGFSDDGNPIVYSLDFWRSGSDTGTATQVQSPLWGNIDIRAECQDSGTSGGVNTTTGIYELKWFVHSKSGGMSYGPIQTLTFDQVQPPNNGDPVLLVYDRHNYSASSPFYYWTTNYITGSHSVEDRWWNTKLRFGQQWNGADARINKEAKFPDGKYRVWAFNN